MYIETDFGTFRRTAWACDDPPSPEFLESPVGRQLVSFFLKEQLDLYGGIDNLKNWCCRHQTVEGKLKMIRCKAECDAWETFRRGAE